MRKAKAIYSELAMAQEPATVTCIRQRLKGRQRSGKVSGVPWRRPQCQGSCRWLTRGGTCTWSARSAHLALCGWS